MGGYGDLDGKIEAEAALLGVTAKDIGDSDFAFLLLLLLFFNNHYPRSEILM